MIVEYLVSSYTEDTKDTEDTEDTEASYRSETEARSVEVGSSRREESLILLLVDSSLACFKKYFSHR